MVLVVGRGVEAVGEEEAGARATGGRGKQQQQTAMPYVPPHLRAGAAPVAAPASGLGGRDAGRRDGGRDYGGSFGGSSGVRRSDAVAGNGSGSYGNGYGRESTGSREGGSSGRGVGVPEVVWPAWQPSERVRKLLPEQIAEVRARLNVDVEITPGMEQASAPIESFEDMCLHLSIMKDVTFHNYTTPTPIQAQALPVALSGKDLLGCAETGSGKTAAFSLPMIQHCLAQPPIRRGDGPLALVLAPTRELAQQIEKEVKAFSRSAEGFKTSIVVGGTNIYEQRSELRAGVEIVVATPGRFIDHLQQGNSSLSRVSYVVLDEADRMLDMGFEPQIREVMRSLPKKHQTLLFSATMPEEIEALAQEYLTNPVRVKVGRVSSPTANVTQNLEKITEKEKIDSLLALLVDEHSQSLDSNQTPPLTIVFVERKARCDEVTDALVEQGLKATALHGGRSQSEREAALRDFRKGTTNILVATDVASRGLDVTGIFLSCLNLKVDSSVVLCSSVLEEFQ